MELLLSVFPVGKVTIGSYDLITGFSIKINDTLLDIIFLLFKSSVIDIV